MWKSAPSCQLSRTTEIPVWIKSDSGAKFEQETGEAKPHVDLCQIRQKILTQIRNRDALPLRKVAGILSGRSLRRQNSGEPRNQSTYFTHGPDNGLNSFCTIHRREPSAVAPRSNKKPIVCSTIQSKKVNWEQNRALLHVDSSPEENAAVQGDNDSETSSYPLPSPPLPPPPDFSSVDSLPTQTNKLVDRLQELEFDSGHIESGYQSNSSFKNILRLHEEHVSRDRDNSTSTKLHEKTRPSGGSNSVRDSTRRQLFPVLKEEVKSAIKDRVVKPFYIPNEGVSSLNKTRVKHLSPLRNLECNYPSSISNSVVASSSETEHPFEEVIKSPFRCYQRERSPLKVQINRSNSVHPSYCKTTPYPLQSPLVYHQSPEQDYNNSSRNIILERKQRELPQFHQFREHIGSNSMTIDVDSDADSPNNVSFEQIQRNRQGTNISSLKTALEKYHRLEDDSKSTQNKSFLVSHNNLRKHITEPKKDKEMTNSCENNSKSEQFPLVYHPLAPRYGTSLPIEKETGQKIPTPYLKYCVSSNTERCVNVILQTQLPSTEERKVNHRQTIDKGVKTQLLEPSPPLPFHRKRTCSLTACSEQSRRPWSAQGKIESAWQFPKNTIYDMEEPQAKLNESGSENAAVGTDDAIITPPHHYTGLGMFQGLSTRLTQNSGRPRERRPSISFPIPLWTKGVRNMDFSPKQTLSSERETTPRKLKECSSFHCECSYPTDYYKEIENYHSLQPQHLLTDRPTHSLQRPRNRNRSECQPTSCSRQLPRGIGPLMESHKLKLTSTSAPRIPARSSSSCNPEVQEARRTVLTQTYGPDEPVSCPVNKGKLVAPTASAKPQPRQQPQRFGSQPRQGNYLLGRYLQRNGSIRGKSTNLQKHLLPDFCCSEHNAHSIRPSLL